MGWQDAPVVAQGDAQAADAPAWSRAPLARPAANDESVKAPISAAMQQHFQSVLTRKSESFEDYINAGFQQSVVGLAKRGKAPDVAVDQDTPWYGRAASSVAGMIGDSPAMVAGFMAGAPVGGAVAGAAGSVVPVAGTAAGIAAGSVMGGFAGANALPAALRATMMEAYEKGEVKSAGDFLDRAMHVAWETTKAGVVGAATGGAGIAAKAALPIAAPIVARVAAPTAAQVATMATVSRALEGELPQPQDFADGAVLLFGLHAVGAGASKLRTIYAKNGKTPAEVVADANSDPELKSELVASVEKKPVAPAVGQMSPAVPQNIAPRTETALPPGLLSTIKSMGGIDSADGTMRDVTGETRTGKGVRGIPPGLFNKGGMGLDDIATQLRDKGYDIPEGADGGVQALKDMIRQEVNGETRHYSAHDEESVFAAARAVRERQGEAEHADFLGDLASEGLTHEPHDIIDSDRVARLAEIDEGALEKAATKYENDDSAFMAEVNRLLDEHNQNRQTAGSGQENSGAAQSQTVAASSSTEAKKLSSDSAIPRAYQSIADEETARAIVPGDKAANPASDIFAESLPQGKGEPSLSTHVNYNYINSADDVKLALARMSEINESEINEARRGTVSWEEAGQEKAQVLSGMLGAADINQVIKGLGLEGASFAQLQAKIGAAKDMVVGAASHMISLAKDIAEKGENATAEDHLQLAAARERTAMIGETFLGNRAELARAMNYLKDSAVEARTTKRIMETIGLTGEMPRKVFNEKAPFAENTIFTSSKVDAARALLRSKIGQLNAGLDPEVLGAGLTIAGAYIEAGVRTFAHFSKVMIADLGDSIKPHLQELYDSAMDASKKMVKGDPLTMAQMIAQIDTAEGAVKFSKQMSMLTSSASKLIEDVKAAIQGSADSGTLNSALDELQNRKQTRVKPDEVKVGVQLVRDAIDKYRNDPKKLAELMERISTEDGAHAFVEETMRSTWWEKIVEAWKAGILSGPVTHMANILGNGTFSVLRAPIDAAASAIGLLRGASVGERVSAIEPIARLTGLLEGTKDGLKVGWAALKSGESSVKGEQFRTAIEGKTGEIIRAPFRLLSAADAVFKTMNSRAETYTLATRQAAAEGLNPLSHEFRERIVSLVNEPTPEMVTASDEAANRFTFNEELGEKGQAVQSLVRKWHLEWMVPFIRTPANVAKELLRMTPAAPLIGEWRADIAKGGVARDKALAELSVGSGTMAVVMSYAFDGNISGAGDPDPGKRRAKMAAGWQPYSIKVGDKWYSYQRLQPFGTLIGMAADVANVWDHMTEEESDKVPKMLSVAFANAITNQTFLQGITNIVNAISDPTRFGPKLVQGMAGSVVPAIVAQPTSMADPIAREVDSVLDAVKARIPVARDTLLPKRDIYGEPTANTERVAGVLPITVKTESEDKVRTEGARIGFSAADTPKKTHVGAGSGKLGDVKLEPDERDRFAEAGGKMAYQMLSTVVNQPSWDALPDRVKLKVYRDTFQAAHKFAAYQAISMEKRIAKGQEVTEKIQAELAR